MKNVKKFKNQVRNLYFEGNAVEDFVRGYAEAKADILELIDQVEQPALPVIPDFVADFIEGPLKKGKKSNGNTKQDMAYIILRLGYGNELNVDVLFSGEEYTYNHTNGNGKLVKYVSGNKLKVIRAIMDGYTVEEKKYYVEDKKHMLLCKVQGKNGWEVISTLVSTEDGLPIEILDYGLTEKEIKDYDERYWAFAVPVEELEE